MKYNIKKIKYNNIFYTNYKYFNIKHNHTSSKYKFPIVYENLLLNKPNVLKENKNKSGIYRLVNKINGESYVGSSINLTNRFYKYYNINHLQAKILIGNSRIYRALLEYGYSNFSLEILEYCNNEYLKIREQYHLDLLKPEYNICKTAGSMLGFKHSLKTLEKFKNRDTGSGHFTIIVNIENNSIKKYNSIRTAAKDIGISHTNLLYHINNNKRVKGIYLIIRHI